jgi:hypothetical protein
VTGKRLADITPFLIEKYKRLRKEDGRSEVTVNRALAFLKNLFTMAMKWAKATENPVKQVRLVREDNGRTRFLTEEEDPACWHAAVHISGLLSSLPYIRVFRNLRYFRCIGSTWTFAIGSSL